MSFGDKLKQNFAKNLQLLRTRNKLTQAKLVDVLNDKYKDYDLSLQRTSIVSYEAKGAMPKIDALYCIADYFGQTIDQIISPSVEVAVITPAEQTDECSAQPALPAETVRWSRTIQQENLTDIHVLGTNEKAVEKLMSFCVEAATIRQFHVEFLDEFLEQLLENAGTEEDKKKIEAIYYKTLFESLMRKSKYLEDVADNLLEKQEFKVFMAFKEKNTQMHMVAKGLDMTEQEVFTIFNAAQTKISSFFKERSKTNLL